MGSSTPSSPSGNTYVKTIDYNMDDDGNRTSVVTTPYGQSATTVTYADNSLNQYTTVGGTSQTYDGNGNLTNNGTYKFKYSYKNLICEVRLSSNDSLVATYKHDANGRRVEKDLASGTDERYVYSGLETVCTYDLSNTWKLDFVFDVNGIDAVLMLEQADTLDQDSDSNTTELTRSFYHRSALGSVMQISSASQTEVSSHRYSPYGQVAITRGGIAQTSDPLGQSWGFTGRLHDAETSLTYYRARHQDPATGRFLQRDPMEAPGNLYQYVRSRPTRFVDPSGCIDIDPPDLQTRAGRAPPALAPAARLPDAFIALAYMDQWLDDGWLAGTDGATWMTRLRDGGTAIHGQTFVWRFWKKIPTGAARNETLTLLADDCVLYEWEAEYKAYYHVYLVEFDVFTGGGAERHGLRGRQQYIYGEFTRGHRSPSTWTRTRYLGIATQLEWFSESEKWCEKKEELLEYTCSTAEMQDRETGAVSPGNKARTPTNGEDAPVEVDPGDVAPKGGPPPGMPHVGQ
jgi:RHS repeat-associated protein